MLIDKYLKQIEQKEILEVFDNIFTMAQESNRNKEFYDILKDSKAQALREDIRGKELEAFVAPLIKLLDFKELESDISKEEREIEREIWDNYELKVKREAFRSTLNFMFKSFILESRKNNANDLFIQKIREKQKEAYKLAYDKEKVNEVIDNLRLEAGNEQYRLNPNQIITKEKFDTLLDSIIKAQEEHNITINQYNSGDFNDDKSSLWSEIFTLKSEAINTNTTQDIIDLILLDLNKKKDRIIKRLVLNRDIKEQKKRLEEESFKEYIDSLNDRQLSIRKQFLEFGEQFRGKYKKEFWEEFNKEKRLAIENSITDEEIRSIFNKINSFSIKYIKSDKEA